MAGLMSPRCGRKQPRSAATLDEMAADRALGLITRSQMLAAAERANTRSFAIDTQLDEAAHVLAPLVAAENAASKWRWT